MTEKLSDRLKNMKMRDVSDSDDDAVERALAAKDELAAHVQENVDGDDEAADVTMEATADAPDEVATFADRLRQIVEQEAQEEEDSQDVRERALQWFLGREEQEEGEGEITEIPDVTPGWEEIEFYAVEPPFAFVRIEQHTTSGEMMYRAIEPKLSPREEEIRDFVHEALVRGLTEDPGDLDGDGRLAFLTKAVRQIIMDYRIRMNKLSQARVEYYVRRDFLGLGLIHVLMQDPDIEDISCDGADHPLFVFHRIHETMLTDVQFEDDIELDGYVIRLGQRGGKAISISDPILDAALPDGSRLQATLGKEVTENGSTFTIRRFKPDPFTPVDLMRFGSISPRLMAWFWLIVENGHSLIFSGGTASGKTTALNAISQFIPHNSKLVSIEDTREVNLPHGNWIKAVTRAGSTAQGEIGMFELLKAALRQRPDYILVGEVRGIEATVAFQAMATGHTVYSTMHADSARSVVYRLENEPINVPRLVLQALDVIAIQGQVRQDGRRVRRVKEVVELVGIDPATRELLTNTVFRWETKDDTFHMANRSYMLERIAQDKNWSLKRLKEDFDRRTKAMELMMAHGMRTVEETTAFARAYRRNPEGAMQRLEALEDASG